MKRRTVYSLVAGLMISLSGITAHTANASDRVNACPKLKMIEHINSPDMKNSAILKQLNDGTYQYQGIGLNTKVKEVHKILGGLTDLNIKHSSKGTIAEQKFWEGSFTSYSANRYADTNNLKIKSISFRPGHRLNRTDIEKVLGESSHVKKMEFGNIIVDYGLLEIMYYRDNNKWLATEYTMSDQKYIKNFKPHPKNNQPGKLKGVQVKPFSKKELLAMDKGTYRYHGVKPGMTKVEVEKLIGEPTSDYYHMADRYHYLSQSYGTSLKSYNVIFQYTSGQCNGEYILDSIKFNYRALKKPFEPINKILGNAQYTAEEPPTRAYIYNHLMVSANSDVVAGKWYVDELMYGR